MLFMNTNIKIGKNIKLITADKPEIFLNKNTTKMVSRRGLQNDSI